MTKKQSTKKGSTKGKAEGSKGKKVDQFTAEAVAYAKRAYDDALAHYTATQGKPTEAVIRYEPWEVDVAQFEQYSQDGRFFAAILADPACPEGFRSLFDAVWTDELLGRIMGKLGGPYLLPLVYPVVRDVLDASNLCGTADGVYNTLIKAVEVLVPDEIADRAREAMRRGE